MNGYADYMIILSPSESVCAQVEKHKNTAAGVIGNYDSAKARAHITVKPMPRRKPYMAEHELMGLHDKLLPLPPITLNTDGFDFFVHGNEYRTIYTKLRSTHLTIPWFKGLKKAMNIKDYLVPHITIARNITTTQHNKLWPHFRKQQWVEDFEVDRLTILYRQAFDTFAPWQTYTKIPFEGKQLISPPPPKESLLKPISGNYSSSQQTSLF